MKKKKKLSSFWIFGFAFWWVFSQSIKPLFFLMRKRLEYFIAYKHANKRKTHKQRLNWVVVRTGKKPNKLFTNLILLYFFFFFTMECWICLCRNYKYESIYFWLKTLNKKSNFRWKSEIGLLKQFVCVCVLRVDRNEIFNISSDIFPYAKILFFVNEKLLENKNKWLTFIVHH